MQARDVMTTDILTIDESTKVDDAIKIMEENGLSSLIIEPLDKKDSYGILTEIDVLSKVVARGHNPAQLSAREIMTKPCIEVKPDLNIRSVAQLFAKTGICAAPIVQKKLFSPKKLLGVISIRDLIFAKNFSGQTNQSKGLKHNKAVDYNQRVIPDLNQGKSARINQNSLTDYQRLRSEGAISAYSTRIFDKMSPQEPTNPSSDIERKPEQKTDNPQQVTPDAPQKKPTRLDNEQLTDYQRLRAEGAISAYSTQIINKMPSQDATSSPSDFGEQSGQEGDESQQATPDAQQQKSTRLGNDKLTDYQRLRAEGAISRYSTRIFDKMPPEQDNS